MNKEVQTKLLEYMQSMEDAVKGGMDFAADQIPLVIQEYIAWYFWEHALYAGGWLIFGFAVLCFLIKKAIPWTKEEWFEGTQWLPAAICVMAVVLSGACFISQAKYCVKAKVAPRVIVIDWIKSNVK